MKKSTLAIYLAGVLFLLIIFSPFTIISAGERGVVVRFGHVKETILNEGFHLKNPLDDVFHYSVQTTKYETFASAASKDLQTVSVTLAVNYHLNPSTVNTLHQNVRGDYQETLLSPAVQDAVKSITAQYTAEELIARRSEVSQGIETLLRERLEAYFFVENINIVNFDFSESFNAAIERKVTAEQEALAARNRLEQTKYEAEQKIIAAQAEAESLRIQAEALAENDALVSLEAVRKWNGELPSYYSGESLPFLQMK